MAKRRSIPNKHFFSSNLLMHGNVGHSFDHRKDVPVKINHELSALGFDLNLKNGKEHWIMKHNTFPVRVDWWPSTGKAVVNLKYRKGIAIYYFDHLITFLQEMLVWGNKSEMPADMLLEDKHG